MRLIDRLSVQRKVIRIYDAGPFGEIEEGFYLREALLVKGWWEKKWVRDDDGELRRFKRRCDASRWAGIHYPGWERQHWVTM